MGYSHSLQRLLHRTEEAQSSSSHLEADQEAPISKAGKDLETRSGVRFASTADLPPVGEESKPCGTASAGDQIEPTTAGGAPTDSSPTPVWTTIELPIPLDTKQMSDARCSVLRSTSNKHVPRTFANSAGLVIPPGPIGASWLPESAVHHEHPCANIHKKVWMKVGGCYSQPP